jgi:hypothetical protein
VMLSSSAIAIAAGRGVSGSGNGIPSNVGEGRNLGLDHAEFYRRTNMQYSCVCTIAINS